MIIMQDSKQDNNYGGLKKMRKTGIIINGIAVLIMLFVAVMPFAAAAAPEPLQTAMTPTIIVGEETEQADNPNANTAAIGSSGGSTEDGEDETETGESGSGGETSVSSSGGGGSTGEQVAARCSGTCPELTPIAPGACSDGRLVDGGKNWCGCQLPPVCVHDRG
jgi:hypothetical protein